MDEIDAIVNDCREIIKKSGKNMECFARRAVHGI